MRPVSTNIFFYSPAGFYAEDFPAMRGIVFEVYWFINRILTVQFHFRDIDFVNIGTRFMEGFMHPREVSRVRAACVDAGVVERDGKYLPRVFDVAGKGKCEGFRIADRYIGKLRRVECGKQSLADKIRQRRQHGNTIDPSAIDTIRDYLKRHLDETHIDQTTASAIINNIPTTTPPDLHLEAKRAGMWMVTDLIARRDAHCERDEFGRIHTPLTQMSRELRPCLSVGGLPLTSLDIKNSQLVFLVLSILSNNQSKNGSTYGTPLLPTSFLPTFPLPIKRKTQQKINKSGTQKDVSEFIEMVMGGQLYDVLMNDIGVSDRDVFKKRLFEEVLFGDDTKPYTDTVLRDVFSSRFPSIDHAIRQAKRDDYRRIAWMLQRSESGFVLDTVVGRMRVEQVNAPCLTIHDSILTTQPHVAPVHAIMMQEFKRLGIQPTVKIEDLSAGAA